MSDPAYRTASFWNNFYPQEVSFLKLPFYDQYHAKAYHARTTRQNWAIERIRQELAASVLRSDVHYDPEQQDGKQEYVHRLLLQLDGGVFCYFEHSEMTVYAPTQELAVACTERFLRQYVEEKCVPAPRFYLLNLRGSGAEVQSVKLATPLVMSPEELGLHYGEDAPTFEQQLIGSLSTSVSGAVVFRGEPGTGKTSFIRHLIAKLRESHRFYYLPLSACRFLASSDMVEFWLGQSRVAPDAHKVVVLEDAEDLLMQRGTDNQAKVSNLLNAADGLLGEFLRLSLILTINCKIDKLDPAITRPGRLIAYREFRRLGAAEARRLAKAKALQLPDQANYSLAEIYCARADLECSPRRSIGFVT